jgi:signal transduction histidine kinase
LFNRKNGLSSNYVLSLEEDIRGNIYIGTNGGGLSRVNVDETTQTFHFGADDSGILIFNIHIDESGAIWVVTNDGLYYFNGSEFKKLILDHPTKGETYFDWVEDDAGNVWVTTNRGILSFRKEDVKNFIRTDVVQIKTRLYNNRDGMKNKECTAATRSFKSSKGEIWVPTNGGASVIIPKQLTENLIPPKVFITQVVTDDHVFQTYAPITVPPGNLRYTFMFTSLSLLAPDKNKFKYKLEPLEKEWTANENAREVQYTNLEPGRYTFSVTGTNNDGIWSNDIASVPFHIKPFFYQTKAFFILSGIVSIALLFGFYKWRVRDIEKRNSELKKVNSELDKFVYSASHDLRAPLSSVLGLINVARMDEDHKNNGRYLNMIEKSISKLDGFIRDIIDFSRNARMDVASDEVAFEKLIREVMEDLKYLDESNRILRLVSVTGQGVFYSDAKRLKVITSNLISNAIKYHNPYAENPIIEVKVDYNEKTAVMQVIDNGSGIAEEHLQNIFKMFYRATDNSKGSGLGLYIVKETIERISGEITVKSEVGKGTTFEITLDNLYAKEFKILKAKTA